MIKMQLQYLMTSIKILRFTKKYFYDLVKKI